MKKSLFKIGLIIVFPLVLIGMINYGIDPDYQLNRSYIKPLVSALLEGKNIAGPVNLNSRVLKKEWMAEREVSEVLVLGSSRTLNLSHEVFRGKTFFNASVTSGSVEDMLGFLGIILDKGKFPEEIIVCADQWLFGDRFNDQAWLGLRNEIHRFCDAAGMKGLASPWQMKNDYLKDRVVKIFSGRYTLRAMRLRGKSEPFVVSDSLLAGKMMILPDGARKLPAKIENTPLYESEELALQYCYGSADENFSDVQPEKIQQLSNMLHFLKQQGCRVSVFIPPYHPKAFDYYQKLPGYEGVFKAEEAVAEVAAQYRFRVIGSSDPSQLSLSGNDFYDGVHLKKEAISRLFKSKNW
ncbi:hypothetical protein INQ51_13375 [Maribellus sp. CM-23]|uniref:hypothetical protein n=1 Tax=Maribellus sp. CM-23 TaxID=2781026 RepID=UPI001F45DECD|nr:hypothetical protein [Maribellus sp. CM-23]MCE4565302.1 hypothetical protein [Maribellus sp. CM-23]